MFNGIILSYQTLTGCKMGYLPTDSPEEPEITGAPPLVKITKHYSQLFLRTVQIVNSGKDEEA